MLEIGMKEARDTLDALVERVWHGEEIVITREGKAVVRLVAAMPEVNREETRKAIEGILELSKGTSLKGLAIKDLIVEGCP